MPECKNALRLGVIEEWYPYVYQDEKGGSAGADTNLLSQILNIMGCRLDIIYFPERRMFKEFEAGHVDIVLGASKNKGRLDKFLYSKPYRVETNKFIHRIDDNDISEKSTLLQIIYLKKISQLILLAGTELKLKQRKRKITLLFILLQ
ncbi:MAG: membrane-bound lytic murein transglycosylase MltF [Colwellia sp.]